MAPNQRFEGHHVDQLSPDTKHALPTPNVLEGSPTGTFHSHGGKHYFSIGLLYVDDILIASHDITALVETFQRRFEITFGENGSRFLGFNKKAATEKAGAIRGNLFQRLGPQLGIGS